MGLTRDQSIQLYGTEAYTGWGETEAKYDAQAKGLSGGNSNPFTNTYNNIMPEINKYVDELIAFAKDDYDWAAKWIEQQFTEAMGTDDQARKEFLLKVANGLEAKIGTIAFDYETNKYRLNEDTNRAIKRLDEDEKVANQEMGVQTNLERRQQNSNLNQRGIIQGTREEATGLASEDIDTLEKDITNRFDALDRYFGRGREDVNTNFTRGLEDITTGARRSAFGAQTQHDYGLEQAQREKERRDLEAEAERKKNKDYLASLGAYLG